MKKYTIELTEEQLKGLAYACRVTDRLILGQLNPLYVAEMMGYPLEWLTLPFLSQDGEAKASKP